MIYLIHTFFLKKNRKRKSIEWVGQHRMGPYGQPSNIIWTSLIIKEDNWLVFDTNLAASEDLEIECNIIWIWSIIRANLKKLLKLGFRIL